MKKLRKLLIGFALLVSVMLPLQSAVVMAQTAKEEVCNGIGAVSGASGCANPAGAPTVDSLAEDIVNILSVLAGVAAVIMIMVAGFKFITSQGESSNIASARSALLYAIIGLVVVALAQIIVRFVVGRL